MTFGELFSQLLGWLGEFIQWLTRWVPRYIIVRVNEVGVKYPRGGDAVALPPGVHWYVPNLDHVTKHYTCRCVLVVPALPLETADGVKCEVGLAVTYRIVDVLAYEVENVNADESIDDAGQAALQDIVTSSKWEDLRGRIEEGNRLSKKLIARLDKSLDRFGVKCEWVRPTTQIQLGDGAVHLFGIGDSRLKFPG